MTLKIEEEIVVLGTSYLVEDLGGITKIYSGGIDYGPNLFLIDETENFLLFWSPSHHSWTGGGRDLTPSTLYLAEKLPVPNGYKFMQVIERLEPSRLWRLGRKTMQERLHEKQLWYNSTKKGDIKSA